MAKPKIKKAIIEFARKQPGGVIRTREAREIYQRMTTGTVSNLTLGRTLRENFVPVEGARGFHVLSEFTGSPDLWDLVGLPEMEAP